MELLILQHTWYNLNSDTWNSVVIHLFHVSLPYLCIFYFVWRHRWHHRGHLGSSAFFVNNFRSNWDWIDKVAIVMALSSRIDWYATWPPSSIQDLRGVTWPWPRGEPWLWPLLRIYKHLYTKVGRYFDAVWWEIDDAVLAFEPCDHFWRSYEPKPNTDLWVIDLTSEVTGWLEILNVDANRYVS